MTTINKKRGRKPKKIDFDEIKTVTNDFSFEEELLIHIPITYDKLVFIDFSKNIQHEKKFKISNKPQIKIKNPTVENFFVKDKTLAAEISTKITTFYSLPPKELKESDIVNYINEKTELACWWCTYQFDTYPVNMPIKYVDKTDSFLVKGNFCSFECCAAYSYKIDKRTSLHLIKFLYKRIFNSKGVTDISMAPPKEILEKFGGTVSIEDYRKNHHKISYFLEYYPVKFIPFQIGERRIESLINQSKEEIRHENVQLSLNLEPIKKQKKEVTAKKVKNIKDFLNSRK